jgi:uncharacterized membrane protein
MERDRMENFIFEYYISPILSHEGYNIVNTITYAIIALVALFAIYQLFKRYHIKVDEGFIYAIIPFILLGSTIRVITDSIDNGKFLPITPIHKLILDSHIYDYGFLTSSPGIYIIIALLFFASLLATRMMKREKILPYIGLALWLPNFLLLAPFLGNFAFAGAIILLAAIPGLVCFKLFGNKIYALMVGAQALDGGATFLILDFSRQMLGLAYFEQHVISNGLCNLFGTCATFYIAKVAISGAAAYLLSNEKDASTDEKYFIALVIIIMGLAPGLRDILRMMAGA